METDEDANSDKMDVPSHYKKYTIQDRKIIVQQPMRELKEPGTSYDGPKKAKKIDLAEPGEEPKPAYIATDLTEEEEQLLIATLKQYKDVFAWSYKDLKGVNPSICQHTIPLKSDAKPSRQRPYTYNETFARKIKEEIDKLKEDEFIYEIKHTDWVSPIVVVLKKNGKLRVCVNLKKVNAATIRDNYPLPNTDHVIERVAGREAYSFLDGFSGYNQLAIKPEDQHKTAFATEWCIFAYRIYNMLVQKKQIQPFKLRGVKIENIQQAEWEDLNELSRFLNGDIFEEVYVTQPRDFVKKGQKNKENGDASVDVGGDASFVGDDTEIIIDRFEPPQEDGDASVDAGGAVGADSAGGAVGASEDTKIIIGKSKPPQEDAREDSDAFVDASGDASYASGAGEDMEIIIEKFEPPQKIGDASMDAGGDANCTGGAKYVRHNDGIVSWPWEDGGGVVGYVRNNDGTVSHPWEDPRNILFESKLALILDINGALGSKFNSLNS
ncbi:hypothetical protein L7F22_023630 [Adiantum nelumboides]|nr:hypothetical protein [Adiantum nelumboides]